MLVSCLNLSSLLFSLICLEIEPTKRSATEEDLETFRALTAFHSTHFEHLESFLFPWPRQVSVLQDEPVSSLHAILESMMDLIHLSVHSTSHNVHPSLHSLLFSQLQHFVSWVAEDQTWKQPCLEVNENSSKPVICPNFLPLVLCRSSAVSSLSSEFGRRKTTGVDLSLNLLTVRRS